MRRALALAALGEGRTAPNPPVGVVVVRDGRVVGEGFHARAGGPHAEVVALAAAGDAARGATLYTTLEPCNHHGRTPPCTDVVRAAGIARVVVVAAAADPDPRVAGGGLRALAEAGIETVLGVCAAEASERLAPFAKHATTGRPLVIAKYAMTLDGRIAARTGDARWVTGPDARRRAHALRDAADAVLVGAGTVRADDPRLTVRHLAQGKAPSQPLRVVLDGRGGLPATSRVFDPALPGRTVLVTTGAEHADAALLAAQGVEIARLPAEPEGRVAIGPLLDWLGARDVMALLVEGGSAVHGAFLDAGLVDRVAAFVAPKLVGGAGAPGPIGGRGAGRMAEAVPLADVRTECVGGDLLVMGRVG
jgi:diaminohydroxyphosphoribosylaminopyrimidine deaminase/5-amino-6-(5-phosphoribosylamino)uracil reductase